MKKKKKVVSSPISQMILFCCQHRYVT